MAVGGFAFEEAPMNAPQYGCEWRIVKVQQKGETTSSDFTVDSYLGLVTY
jgi:hypothetical protein